MNAHFSIANDVFLTPSSGSLVAFFYMIRSIFCEYFNVLF
jgi:hypothetical protein